MTEKPFPTAQRMIGEAITVALDPSSTELALRRGELALAIARELREGTPRRPLRAVPNDAEITNRDAKESPDPEAPTPREPVPANVDERLRMLRRPADLRFGFDRAPAEPTAAERATAVFEAFAGPVAPEQWAAAAWTAGDTADCVHCHTPVVLVARRMKDPVGQGEGDFTSLWVHKYTDQRTCMTPTTGDTMTDLDATAVHTFATPPILGNKG